MQMNYVPKHCHDYFDSECVSYISVDSKDSVFVQSKYEASIASYKKKLGLYIKMFVSFCAVQKKLIYFN